MHEPAPQLTLAPAQVSEDSRRGRAIWMAVGTYSARTLAIALTVGLLTAAAAAALALTQPARYESQATLVIDSPRELATAADDGVVNKLSRLRFKYAALVGTPRIAEPAARAAQVPLAAVYEDVQVRMGEGTLELATVATTDDAAASQRIAQAVAVELQRYVEDEHERFGIAPDRRFRFEIVADAYPGAKISPTKLRALSVALLGGVLAVALSYALIQVLDAARRR